MELLKIYEPLIMNQCKVYGYMDEDCRQYLQLRLVIAIRDFVIQD